MDEWVWVGRIALAGALAALIGLERQYHYKEAGLRTHFLVGLGSATLMLVSKHGFWDVATQPGADFDPARVAAQVVTGIGFIGAGTIIFRRNVIHGLTTAAGLWATSAMGLAVGAGMYIVGIFSTGLVLIGLLFLDRIAFSLRVSRLQRVVISIPDQPGAIGRLGTAFGDMGVNIGHMEVGRASEGRMGVDLHMRIPPGMDIAAVLTQIRELAGVEIINVSSRDRWPWHRGGDSSEPERS